MAQANLSVRIDEKDKKSIEIKADPFYSKSNIEYLEKIVSDIQEGKAKFIEHELIEE